MKTERTAKATGSCGFCGSDIPVPDIDEKRAGVMSGKMCCAACLESGAWFGSGKTADARICRAEPRHVPTLHFDLRLRLPGWRGRLQGNLARQWLDVSGEGLRAIVGRRCAVGDLLMAVISYRPTGKVHEIVSCVRNVQESRKFPGSVVAGFLFANATVEFRALIQETYGAAGLLDRPAKDTKKIG